MYIYFCAPALSSAGDLFALLEVECGSLATLSFRTVANRNRVLLFITGIIFQTAINSRGVFINLSLLSLFQVSGEANYLRCLWQMEAVDVSKHTRWQMGNQLWPTVWVMRHSRNSLKKKQRGKNSINQIREEISLICTLSGVLIKSGLRNYPDRGIRQAKLAEELKKIFALLLLPSWTISRKNLSALGLPPPRCGVCFCSRRHQAKRSLQRRAE